MSSCDNTIFLVLFFHIPINLIIVYICIVWIVIILIDIAIKV